MKRWAYMCDHCKKEIKEKQEMITLYGSYFPENGNERQRYFKKGDFVLTGSETSLDFCNDQCLQEYILANLKPIKQ